MTLRLTREEGVWLRSVLDAYRAIAVDALKGEPGEEQEQEERRDRDMATGMMDLIDEAMARKT